MIKMLRVDDRLIHGQVAMVWTSFLDADTIVVGNDKAASNQLSTMALSLAKPTDCDLQILSVNDTAVYLNNGINAGKKIFAVVENTADALAVCRQVPGIEKVVLGGMRNNGGKKLIVRQIFVDEGDIADCRAMEEIGANVYSQIVPSEKVTTLKDIERIYKK
jgi:PTS system mannose-specific IIB component/fructoselysine and glucoselysine-specific PTS system IIB component